MREHFHLVGERLGPRLFALAKSITNATRAEKQPPSPLEKALRVLTERLGGGSSAHTTQARRALWTEVVLCTMQLFLPVLLITSENDTHGAGNAGFDLVSRHVARDVLAPILHQLDEIYEWVHGPSTSVTAEGQRQQPRSGGVLDWSHHSRRRSSLLQWRQRLAAVGRTGRAELRRPWGPRNSLPPSEGRTEASRAPLFPSHSGHSSDRWSSDPGDAPRA